MFCNVNCVVAQKAKILLIGNSSNATSTNPVKKKLFKTIGLVKTFRSKNPKGKTSRGKKSTKYKDER